MKTTVQNTYLHKTWRERIERYVVLNGLFQFQSRFRSNKQKVAYTRFTFDI